MSARNRSPIWIVGLVIAIGLPLWLLFGQGGTNTPTSTDPSTEDTPATALANADPLVADGTTRVPTLEASGTVAEVPTPTAQDTEATYAWWVEGRVLDERRRPVEGAKIRLIMSYTDVEDLTTRTGADGSYRVGGGPLPTQWASVAIHAVKGATAGLTTVYVSPDTEGMLAASIISLDTAHEFAVQVQDPAGAPLAGGAVMLQRMHAWRLTTLESLHADENGTARFKGLPAESYRVIAAHDGHGRAFAVATLPRKTPAPVTLRLTAPHTLVVMVKDKESGEPIAGAQVYVDEFASAGSGQRTITPLLPAQAPETLLTDARGECVVYGLGVDDLVQVAAEAEGYMTRGPGRTHTSLPKGAAEHTLELLPVRTVRFPLDADNPHAPPEGTELKLLVAPGTAGGSLPSSARIEDGHVVTEGAAPTHFHAIVEAPDGAFAQLFAVVEGAYDRKIKFLKPAKITVLVKSAEGTPVAGRFVSARNQGNNMIGTPVQTDEAGTAVLTLRYAHLVDVYVAMSNSPWSGVRSASVDLAKTRETSIEAVTQPEHPVRLTLRINGETRLPARFSVRGALDMEENPDAGALSFSIAGDPTKERRVQLVAPGFLSETVLIPPMPNGKRFETTVDLSRGGTIVLRTKMPADGNARVDVHPPGQMTQGMRFPGSGTTKTALGVEDGWTLLRYGPLRPGTYVGSDSRSHVTTEEVILKEGETQTIDLDLSAAGYIAGTVELPPDYDARKATVQFVWENGPPSLFLQPARVRSDGTFRLRAGSRKPIRIRVAHPELIPADEGGTVEVAGPTEGIVLRLVEGATAQFRLDPPVDGSTLSQHAYGPKVRLLLVPDGAPEDMPQRLQSFAAQEVDGVWRARGIPLGTHHLVLDVPKRAPLNLGKVTLKAQHDLGLLTHTAGATVRIKLVLPAGQSAPRLSVTARIKEPYPYSRGLNAQGGEDILLGGVGPGIFELSASPVMGMMSRGPGANHLAVTVTSDGASEIVVEYDLSK